MSDGMNISCPQCTNVISAQAPGSLFCPSCEYLFDVDETGVEVFGDIDVVPHHDRVFGREKIVNPRALEEDPTKGRLQKYFKRFAFVFYLVYGVVWAAVIYNMKTVQDALVFSVVVVCYIFGRKKLISTIKSGFNLEAQEKTIAKYLDIIFVIIVWPIITTR